MGLSRDVGSKPRHENRAGTGDFSQDMGIEQQKKKKKKKGTEYEPQLEN